MYVILLGGNKSFEMCVFVASLTVSLRVFMNLERYSQTTNKTAVAANQKRKHTMNNEDNIPVGKIVGVILLATIVVLGLSWAFTGNDFFLYKVFAPKMEQVRHDTFKQSQAYNDGMASQLENMQFKYAQADAEAKGALAPIILHTVGAYDTTKLPPDLQAFVSKVKNDVLTSPVK